MQTLTPEELHQQYAQTVAAYGALLPEPALRVAFAHQVDGYFRQYLLALWKAGGESVEQRQVDIYNAVWSRADSAPAALYWEVATGVARAGDFCPPAFFADLRSYDRQHATSLSRRFADQLTLLLLLFASADGGVSEEEAGYVNACSDALLEQCRLDGIRPDGPGVNAGDYVSRRTSGKSAPQAPAAPQKQTREPTQDQTQTQKQPEEEPLPSLDELLSQLDGLCGLDQVKKDVKSLINLVKVRKLRQQADLPVPPMSLHLVGFLKGCRFDFPGLVHTVIVHAKHQALRRGSNELLPPANLGQRFPHLRVFHPNDAVILKPAGRGRLAACLQNPSEYLLRDWLRTVCPTAGAVGNQIVKIVHSCSQSCARMQLTQ